MKYVLLTAISLLLISNNSAIAEDRSSAGAAAPVKLGGDNRNPYRAKSAPVKAAADQSKAAADKSKPAAQTTPAATAPADTTAGAKTSGVDNYGSAKATKKTASIRGMIPPPPDVMVGAGLQYVPKRKKKAAAATAPTKLVTVGKGGPYSFTGRSQDDFSTLFNWAPDSKDDTLTFKAKFSPVGAPGQAGTHLNWVRIMLGDRVLANEQTLKGKDSFTSDLSGTVGSGPNQIVVKGQGNNGATFEWSLTTPRKPKLTSVQPDEVVVGETLTLTGDNFETNPALDIVNIGRKTLVPTTATATALKVKIPKNFEPGDYLVKVTIDGLSSHEVKVTIRGIPVLTGTSLQGVPPGANLTIYGKNFSKKLADNKVMFDSTNAEVVACTTDQLTVIVPNFYTGLQQDTGGVAGQVGIPIRVKVGKVEASNTVSINVGNSTWDEPGLKTGPGIPTVPVDWRSLLDN